MISNENIFFNTARMSVNGDRTPNIGGYIDETPLDAKMEKSIEDSKITMDEYLIMSSYARWLPSGLRQMKLNMPKLRDELISVQLKKEPLSIVSGLRTGGLVSKFGSKAITQLEYIQNIKNNNRISNYQNLNGLNGNGSMGFDPNYTSWKNSTTAG